MSEVMVLAAEGTRCKCDNCGWEGDDSELEMIADFEERVTAGEIVPAGQCPECHALAHQDPPADWSIESQMAKAKESLGVATAALAMIADPPPGIDMSNPQHVAALVEAMQGTAAEALKLIAEPESASQVAA